MKAPPRPPLTAVQAFGRIADGLRLAIGARSAIAGRKLGPEAVLIPILALAWTRIGQAARRFARLVARIKAGKLKPPRQRKVFPTAAKAAAPEPPPPTEEQQEEKTTEAESPAKVRLPPWPGWLIHVVGSHAACLRSQLEHRLKTDPEMAELMAAAPAQMARILRPVCRMLGMDLPPALQQPQPQADPPADPETPPDPAEPAAAPPRRQAPAWKRRKIPLPGAPPYFPLVWNLAITEWQR